MKKLIFGLAIFAISTAVGAVQVVLIAHNQTSGGGAISTLITDGSHTSGITGMTTAAFDWDGTTLSSTGLYSQVGSIGSSPLSATILADRITDLNIDVGAASATASAYTCTEGTFLSVVGANGCGGYTLGANTADDSTTVWGPGTAVTQTIGGDDMGNLGPTTGDPRTIGAYDFDSLTLVSGASTTDTCAVFTIGNGVPLGENDPVAGGGEAMCFHVDDPSCTVAPACFPPPVAVDDLPGGVVIGCPEQGDTVTIDVLANDEGTQLAPLIVRISMPRPMPGGTVNSDNTIDFTGGSVGPTSFQYNFSNTNPPPNDLSNDATVYVETLAMGSSLSGPIANDYSETIGGNNTRVLDLVALGIVMPGNGMRYAIDVPPSNGVAAFDSASSPVVRYTPDRGFGGNDSFTYTATDCRIAADSSDSGKISFEVVKSQDFLPGKTSSLGPLGLGLLTLLGWFRRRLSRRS